MFRQSINVESIDLHSQAKSPSVFLTSWTVSKKRCKVRMKTFVFLAMMAALLVLTGCNTGPRVSSWGQPVARGTKPLSQVAPCCRDMVQGKITLAQCMEKPECKANGRACCMNAF